MASVDINSNNTIVTVTETGTETVTVNTQGPRGPEGPIGPPSSVYANFVHNHSRTATATETYLPWTDTIGNSSFTLSENNTWVAPYDCSLDTFNLTADNNISPSADTTLKVIVSKVTDGQPVSGNITPIASSSLSWVGANMGISFTFSSSMFNSTPNISKKDKVLISYQFENNISNGTSRFHVSSIWKQTITT